MTGENVTKVFPIAIDAFIAPPDLQSVIGRFAYIHMVFLGYPRNTDESYNQIHGNP